MGWVASWKFFSVRILKAWLAFPPVKECFPVRSCSLPTFVKVLHDLPPPHSVPAKIQRTLQATTTDGHVALSSTRWNIFLPQPSAERLQSVTWTIPPKETPAVFLRFFLWSYFPDQPVPLHSSMTTIPSSLSDSKSIPSRTFFLSRLASPFHPPFFIPARAPTSPKH